MQLSRCLIFALASLCYAFHDDLDNLLKGEDIVLDLDSFWPSDHSIESVHDAYSSNFHASSFLNDLNNELQQWKSGLALAEWTYKTNITDHTRDEFTDMATHFHEWRLRRIKEAKRFDLASLPDDLSRQIKVFSLSAASSDARINQRATELQGTMEGIYSSGTVCLRNGSCLTLEPEIINIMAHSRDPELLKEVWVKWRSAVGPKIKDNYLEYINLLNAGAVENGYSDYSQFWKHDLFYETPELDGMLHNLWVRVRPLYLQLHAYIRRKLREHYGSAILGNDGTIPAHLLGNVWAQHWTNLMEIVSPFPEVDGESQIDARLKRHVDVHGMFQMAERFYKSIWFHRMTPTFWKKSMLTKPVGESVVCHAAAFDMYYPGDFRIKMCTDVTSANFRTVHHEMGHIEYFMAYADQPTIFRSGANAAFHEAVGDTIGLSVMSVTHMKALGLLDDDEHSGTKYFQSLSENRHRQVKRQKTTINNLLHMALEKLAFLPFGILVDTWRWGVMQGRITPENYNRMWWEMRLEFQGIRSPVPRSERDFDPGAKYHIPANSAYISYFVSYIQQFQMYKSLCQESSWRGPLHECDFYGSKAAGNKLRHVLSAGSSLSWQSQLKHLTGNATVTTDAILEYFQPLYDWLARDNSIHGEKIGWDGARINWDH